MISRFSGDKISPMKRALLITIILAFHLNVAEAQQRATIQSRISSWFRSAFGINNRANLSNGNAFGVRRFGNRNQLAGVSSRNIRHTLNRGGFVNRGGNRMYGLRNSRYHITGRSRVSGARPHRFRY